MYSFILLLILFCTLLIFLVLQLRKKITLFSEKEEEINFEDYAQSISKTFEKIKNIPTDFRFKQSNKIDIEKTKENS